jgi:hypothetical protein
MTQTFFEHSSFAFLSIWQKLQPVNHNAHSAFGFSLLQVGVVFYASVHTLEPHDLFFPSFTVQVLHPSNHSVQPASTIAGLTLISFGFS